MKNINCEKCGKLLVSFNIPIAPNLILSVKCNNCGAIWKAHQHLSGGNKAKDLEMEKLVNNLQNAVDESGVGTMSRMSSKNGELVIRIESKKNYEKKV